MTDEELFEIESRVAAAIRGWDDVPDGERSRARDTFELRRVDGELARLGEESGQTLDGARADADVATVSMTFESGATTIEVEVDEDDRGLRLVGQIVPPERSRVVVEGVDDTASIARGGAPADDLGRFLFDITPGLIRLRLTDRPGERVDVVTDFFWCRSSGGPTLI